MGNVKIRPTRTYTPCGPTTGLLCIIGLICGSFMEEKGCHGGTLLIRIVQEGNSRRGSRVGAKYFHESLPFAKGEFSTLLRKRLGMFAKIFAKIQKRTFSSHISGGEGGGFFPKLDTKHGEPAFPSRDAGNYPLLFLELSNYYMKH